MSTDVSKVTHVIFDVDGLLLDTEKIYTEIVSKLCAEYGHTFTWELKALQMGRKPYEAAQVLIDKLQLPLTNQEYIDSMEDSLCKAFPSAELMPGAEQLVRHLAKHGIPMGIATGSTSTNLQLKITRHTELWRLFTHSVASGDDPEVVRGKPDPLIFQVTSARFPCPPSSPSQILVFEDAPNGVEAAVRANMRVAWVPDKRADRTPYEDNSLVTIYDSLLDFQPELFGLPAFDKSTYGE